MPFLGIYMDYGYEVMFTNHSYIVLLFYIFKYQHFFIQLFVRFLILFFFFNTWVKSLS